MLEIIEKESAHSNLRQAGLICGRLSPAAPGHVQSVVILWLSGAADSVVSEMTGTETSAISTAQHPMAVL